MKLKFRIYDTFLKQYVKGATLHKLLKKSHDRFVFQLSSGLQDENGKEIYEGDIVKFYDDLFIVKFDDGGGEDSGWGEGLVKFVGFYLEPIDVNNLAYYSSIYSLIDSWHDVRGNVIGNIYENPELLEVKNV